MANCHSIEHVDNVIDNVVPSVTGAKITSKDVRGLLNQISNFYPETAPAMDVASRLITHLETLRHEAILSLSLGDINGTLRLLKQAAAVEVIHG